MIKAMQHIRKSDGEVVDREKLLRWFSRYLDKMPDGEQIIEFVETTRTNTQNAYYWVVLGIMAREFGTTPQELHEYCKAEFLPTQSYFTLIRHKRMRSTTAQTKDEMAEYIDKVIAFAAEQGVVIPDIEEYKHTLV